MKAPSAYPGSSRAAELAAELDRLKAAHQRARLPAAKRFFACVGDQVIVRDTEDGVSKTYSLVDEGGQPQEGLISASSQLGKAPLGAREGTCVTVPTRLGTRRLQIVEVAAGAGSQPSAR